MRIKFYAFFLVALLFAERGISQTGVLTEKPNTPINEMVGGYIEILPNGYDPNAAQPYPLIIFLEGQGQLGTGSPEDIPSLYGPGMIPTLVRDGHFTNSFTVGGDEYRFVILVPQVSKYVNARDRVHKFLSPTEVNDVVNYAVQHYNVDVNRVYLLGLSSGGGSAWAYPGASVDYGNRLAAVVPMSGSSKLSEDDQRDDRIAQANLPLWTFVGADDNNQEYPQNAQDYVTAILNQPSHGPTLMTVFDPGTHEDAWTNPIEKNITGNATYTNLYEWLLGYSRSLTQPVFAHVDAGADHTVTLASGSAQLSDHTISFAGGTVTLNGDAYAVSGGPAIASTEWVRVSGTGGNIATPGNFQTVVSGLKPGSYTFQLRATDVNGLTTTDEVNVNIIAPAGEYYKIEAENFSARSGSSNFEYTSYDEGPAYSIGWLGAGSTLQYEPGVATTGKYALYFRYSGEGGALTVSADGKTSNLKTLATGGGWQSDSVHINLSPASTLSINMQAGGSNLNYYELVLLSADASLPVKFEYFNTQCSNGAVSVRWKTAQEQNSNSFTVQRSTDGANWTDIGTLPAAGQSSSGRSYVFVDRTPPATAYYRVAEKDADGKSSLTNTVKSACGATGKASLYPNPNNGSAAVNLALEQPTTVTMRVVNAGGILIQQQKLQLPAGVSVVPVDITSQPNGIYTIELRYPDRSETLKMLKK